MTVTLHTVSLCMLCKEKIAGSCEGVELVEKSYQCQLCFGILDPEFISEVSAKVQHELDQIPYDASTFVLALNLPTSQTLRENMIMKLRPDFNGTLSSVPFKLRNINAYLSSLSESSGKRPTLYSDLQLMITFENDEFNDTDLDFLKKNFPNDFRMSKKRRYNNTSDEKPECSKQQLQQVSGRINPDIARKFNFALPTKKCIFRLDFERDPVYIAGRYCKYARNLPQSPWSEEKDGPKEVGHSVSEKVCDILKAEFGASSSRFITSGREDIDVRMLGSGRPFVVELKNCHVTAPLRGLKYMETLVEMEARINKNEDVKVNFLTRLQRDVAEKLSIGEEDKKKQYTAYCYSTLPVDPSAFEEAAKKSPFTIVQKTPIRVLKRRSLLDRPRTIYSLEFLRLDDHHFLTRLETQAGTYIKEFVHGDFGRTQPSLGDLLGVAAGEVDILELDVEHVDVEWPPIYETPINFR